MCPTTSYSRHADHLAAIPKHPPPAAPRRLRTPSSLSLPFTTTWPKKQPHDTRVRCSSLMSPRTYVRELRLLQPLCGNYLLCISSQSVSPTASYVCLTDLFWGA